MHHSVKSKKTKGGSSLISTLLLVFIILKLTHVIDWAWVWVLSPLWIGIGLGLIFFIVIGVAFVFGISYITSAFSDSHDSDHNY